MLTDTMKLTLLSVQGETARNYLPPVQVDCQEVNDGILVTLTDDLARASRVFTLKDVADDEFRTGGMLRLYGDLLRERSYIQVRKMHEMQYEPMEDTIRRVMAEEIKANLRVKLIDGNVMVFYGDEEIRPE